MKPGSPHRDSMAIVICTHNRSEQLGRTLQSLADQKVKANVSWSVVVVDNNCEDDTPVVAHRFREEGRIPELKLVHEPKQGLAYARRCGFEYADAELVAFVDDDCVLDPNWISEAVDFANEHKSAGAIGGRVTLDWAVDPTPFIAAQRKSLSHQDYGDLPRRLPRNGFAYLVGAGLVCRRNALERSGALELMQLVGRQGKALSAGDDSEIVLRVRNAGFELWYNPAMNLVHSIGEERMDLGYHAELRRNVGRTWAVLTLLASGFDPTVRVRALLVIGSFVTAAKRVYTALRRRGRNRSRLRLAIAEARGTIAGALGFFFKGRRFDPGPRFSP